MSETSKKLRDHVMRRGGPARDEAGNYIGTVWPLMLEAADEIERLEGELENSRSDIKFWSP